MNPASQPVALITGAAGGIGIAMVQAFESAGWQVVSTDRQPLPRDGHVEADIGCCVDPLLPDHQALVAALRTATGGRLQALVANAAHQVVKPSGDLSAQDWQQTLGVNLLAPFWLAMAFRDELASNRGSFLAISSIHERLTMQTFAFEAILAAHRAYAGDAADDVEVARAYGLAVAIVAGEERNLKLTYADDFGRAEEILRGDGMDIRVGYGFDVHRFRTGDHMWLCGVKLPFAKGLEGHSDADVGMHALTDAIYGALACGDIGQHFPPSEMRWNGAASHIFLEHACGLAQQMGFRVTHADVTLICERPKIGPHAVEMRGVLAQIMGLEVDQVSVKATTSERLGFTGREEGIAAMATATLVSK